MVRGTTQKKNRQRSGKSSPTLCQLEKWHTVRLVLEQTDTYTNRFKWKVRIAALESACIEESQLVSSEVGGKVDVLKMPCKQYSEK